MELPIHMWQTARSRGILAGSRVYKIHVDSASARQEHSIIQTLGAHAHFVQWSPGGASMMFAAGGDVDSLDVCMSETRTMAILCQLASALVHIQACGYVHTHIAPCHVLLDATKRTAHLTGLRACVRLEHLAPTCAFEAPFAAPELLEQSYKDDGLDGGLTCATWHSWPLAITMLIAMFGQSPWSVAMPSCCAKYAEWTACPTPDTLARLCGIDHFRDVVFGKVLCGLLSPCPTKRLLPIHIIKINNHE